ncbi:MAG: hypothetical protein WCH99_16755 [Verrucomicrobiota bacterium]
MTFTSWKALLVIISAIAAAAFYGINWPQDGLAEQFRPPVMRYLQAEQARRVTVTFAPNGVEKLSREELKKLAGASATGQNITINSLKVRGTLLQAVAQVVFRVDGKTPPDGREVRYLLLRQSGFGDWQVDRGTTVKSYYFAF